jgi:hypothetical protein
VEHQRAIRQLGARLTSLLQLPEVLARLTGEARRRADRLLDVRIVRGRTDPPPEMDAWLERTFGSVDAVRDQMVVKVMNLATLEATVFAALRARRPLNLAPTGGDLAAEIQATEGGPFCHPETDTPADVFGRVRGAHVVTGANAALAEAHHGVIVFDRHDPLAFDAELIGDVLTTGREWAESARTDDATACNYFLLWNCLWRAGGSVVHGHAQVLLGSGSHVARLERLRRDVEAYRASAGADLIADIVGVHRDMGLVRDIGDVALMGHVTPVKERELLVVGKAGGDERDRSFVDALARTLIAYRDRIGVRSFNLAIWRPPLGDGGEAWGWLPPIARIVDRGDPFQRSSDIGAMELYGTPIVATDPYDLLAGLDGP